MPPTSAGDNIMRLDSEQAYYILHPMATIPLTPVSYSAAVRPLVPTLLLASGAVSSGAAPVGNLFVCQWNAHQAYPYKLERIA